MSIRNRGLCFGALSLALVFAAPAGAEQNFLKVAPAPAAKVGPTIAAAKQFCGDAADKASALFERYSKSDKLKKVYESPEFIAYADDEKAPTVMYTFTLPKNAAHPAAVCRRAVKEGDSLVLKMEIVCDGKEEACGALSKDFTNMNAVMQAQVDGQINDAKK